MKKKYQIHEEGGLKHWAADIVDCDTHIACDLLPMIAGEEDLVGIDCVDCLRMIIYYLLIGRGGISKKASTSPSDPF